VSLMKATSQLEAPMHWDTAVLLAATPVVFATSSPWAPLMAPHTCRQASRRHEVLPGRPTPHVQASSA
jgi:hypothetical protein